MNGLTLEEHKNMKEDEELKLTNDFSCRCRTCRKLSFFRGQSVASSLVNDELVELGRCVAVNAAGLRMSGPKCLRLIEACSSQQAVYRYSFTIIPVLDSTEFPTGSEYLLQLDICSDHILTAATLNLHQHYSEMASLPSLAEYSPLGFPDHQTMTG
nr:hypothetical protein Iba_chr01aCG4280 [Ipomoea batatas]